jgi:exosortase
MHMFVLAIGLMWLQLFWSLVPTWRFGEYYQFGWFVPILAVGLIWRRWNLLGPGANPNPAPKLPIWTTAIALLCVIIIIPLRLVTTADPGWRPPLLLHVFIVFSATHLLLWKGWGRGVSLGLMPATLFALSAVPYPWQLEQALIRKLTGTVINLTREAFLLAGKPVELLGERLAIGTNVVEVTDGCSGIRSLQSLIMVALFFGELLFLSFAKRLGLILVAAICAIGVNTIRAYWLAEIHFTQGKQAAAAAHDTLGHAAFIASAVILYLAALLMLRSKPPGKLVITHSQPVTS